MKKTIKYDKPIEVTEKEYNKIMIDLKGSCAGQTKDGKFYVKCWDLSYKEDIQRILR